MNCNVLGKANMSIWVGKQSDVNVNKQKRYVIHAVIIQQHVIINDFGQTMHIYFIFEITSIRHIYINFMQQQETHILIEDNVCLLMENNVIANHYCQSIPYSCVVLLCPILRVNTVRLHVSDRIR
jgi:hypothetical protein